MGVAAPLAPLGSRSPGPPPPKSRVTGPSLLVNCYIKIKFKIKIKNTKNNFFVEDLL